MIDIRAHRQKMTGDEPDAKAILPKPRSVQKAISYQILAKDNLSQKVIDRIEYNSHKTNWWGHPVGAISKVGVFKTNADKITHCCGTKADIKAVTAATEVCREMGVAIKGDATYNLEEVNEVVASKYPMMSYMEHNYTDAASRKKNLTDYINLVDAAS